ncbi:MAG: CrcB family protein [bacterium]
MLGFLYLFLGGGIGTVCRYFVYVLTSNSGITILGTLIINLIGSFLVGFFYSFFNQFKFSTDVKNGVILGLIGGFSTLAALNLEGFLFLQKGKFLIPFFYITATIIFGLLLVYLGMLFFDFLVKFVK